MALTDPELDLLLEILDEDPEADVYLDVGTELVRRARWEQAVAVLGQALATRDDAAGFVLLARAALEVGDYSRALAAVGRVAAPSAELRRVELLAKERAGALDGARVVAVELLAADPNDEVVSAALERLDAPPPSVHGRAADPFVTVDRAERFVAVGRVDRAVRLYRRLLFHNPHDRSIAVRLGQLESEDAPADVDDLSDELTDPRLAPPEFAMPAPGSFASRAEPAGPVDPTTPGDPPLRRRRRSLSRR